VKHNFVGFVCVSVTVASALLRASTVTDLASRFSLDVPPGWQTSRDGNFVRLTGPGAYILAMPVDGGGRDPKRVDQIRNQFVQQWRGIRLLQSGPASLGAAPAQFSIFAGQNPNGQDAILKTITTTAGDTAFLLVFSSPTAQWTSLKAAVAQVENSFRVLPASAPHAVPTRHHAQSQTPPPGFQMVSRTQTGGQSFQMSFQASGNTSARSSFKGLYPHIGQYFDAPPALVGAYGDAAGRSVQAFFRASYRGARVIGMVLIAISGAEAKAAFLFDDARVFGRSFAQLSRGLAPAGNEGAGGGGGGGGGGEAQPLGRPLPLTPTMFPDGSGSMGLPAGWKIGSSWKGIVDATGPNGQLIIFGYYQQVAVNYFGQRPQIPGFLTGPYRAPAAALAAYVDSYTGFALSRGQGRLRIIEQVPTQGAGGQSAYISYDLEMQGKAARGLALISTAPIDNTTWVFYMSSVATMRERFNQDFPTMWEMWRSWTVNPAVFRERMDSALRSMRETFRILQETNANTQRTYDRTNLAWSQTIRGVTTIENTVSGWRGDVETRHVDEVVRQLNENGYQYRVVPLPELVP